MNKKLLITSALFILISCSDGFIELEERVKSHTIKNNIESKPIWAISPEITFIQTNGRRIN